MVLTMEEKVKCDEVIVMGWRAHVKQEAMDAVLDKGPQEHPQQEDEWEPVLVDQKGVLWRRTEINMTRY